MRFYEFKDSLSKLTEDSEILRMKKINGRFVKLSDDDRYDGKVYYFKRGPSSYFSVDPHAVFNQKKSKNIDNRI